MSQHISIEINIILTRNSNKDDIFFPDNQNYVKGIFS